MVHHVGVDCVFRCMRCGCMRSDLDEGSVESAKDSRIAELEKALKDGRVTNAPAQDTLDLVESVASTIYLEVDGMGAEDSEERLAVMGPDDGTRKTWERAPEWERDDYRAAAKAVLRVVNDAQAAERPSERVRVQFDLSPKAKEALDEIRADSQATSNAEVVRNALRIFGWYVAQTKDGSRLQVVSPGGAVHDVDFAF